MHAMSGLAAEYQNLRNPKKVSRSGKWTLAEEEFANALIEEFKAGSLPTLPEGTSMRGFLAKRLRCLPKRVSKKFENTNYNGKLQYMRNKTVDPEETVQCRLRLYRLEQAFLQSIDETDDQESTALADWPQHPREVLPASVSLLQNTTSLSSSGIASSARKRSEWGDSLAANLQTTAEVEWEDSLATAGLEASHPNLAALRSGRRASAAEASLWNAGYREGLGLTGSSAAAGGMLGGAAERSMMGMPQQPPNPFLAAASSSGSLRSGLGTFPNNLTGMGRFGAANNFTMNAMKYQGAFRQQQQQKRMEEEARMMQLQMDMELEQQQRRQQLELQNRRRQSILGTALAFGTGAPTPGGSSLPRGITAEQVLGGQPRRSSMVGQDYITAHRQQQRRASLGCLSPSLATAMTMGPGATTGFSPYGLGAAGRMMNASNLNTPPNMPPSGLLSNQQSSLETLERQTRLQRQAMLASTPRRAVTLSGQQHLLQDSSLDCSSVAGKDDFRQQLKDSRRRPREPDGNKQQQDEDGEAVMRGGNFKSRRRISY